MKNYIWLPVYSAEMLGMAETWTAGQAAKGKLPSQVLYTPYEAGMLKGIHRRASGGCLRAVAPESKLYLLLHGSGTAEGRYVGATRSDGATKSYTPEQLAMLMESEGLTKKIGRVSLFSCGSGLGLEMSYAARLKRAMVSRGFLFVTVAGYLGDVKTSYVQRYITEGEDLYTVDAHKGVVVGDRCGWILPASSRKVIF